MHWFLIHLPQYVKRNYWVNYDYVYHDYFICRKCRHVSMNNFRFMDMYIVKRTSRKCWRLMAYNMETAQVMYRTHRKSSEIAREIAEIAVKWHNATPWTCDREYIENAIKKQKK